MKKTAIAFIALSFLIVPLSSLGVEIRREAEYQNREMAPVDTLSVEENDLPEPALEAAQRRIADPAEIREQKAQEIRERRVVTEQRVQEMREDRAAEAEERRERLQERLQNIQDEARRRRAEALADTIERLNRNLSDRYSGYIDALELVLSKIESRVLRIEDERNIDLAPVRQKIADANDLIDQARQRIADQKAKDYIVDLDSEETLREDFRKTLDLLRDDHQQLKEEILPSLRNLIRDIMLELADALVEVEAE